MVKQHVLACLHLQLRFLSAQWVLTECLLCIRQSVGQYRLKEKKAHSLSSKRISQTNRPFQQCGSERFLPLSRTPSTLFCWIHQPPQRGIPNFTPTLLYNLLHTYTSVTQWMKILLVSYSVCWERSHVLLEVSKNLFPLSFSHASLLNKILAGSFGSFCVIHTSVPFISIPIALGFGSLKRQSKWIKTSMQ